MSTIDCSSKLFYTTVFSTLCFMLLQSTNTIVMVPPDHFGYNPETAQTNPYQHDAQSLHKHVSEIRATAHNEFKNTVILLRQNGIRVLVLDNGVEATPDAVFPNNWFSHHNDGKLVIYPMLTPNRRLERQTNSLVTLLKQNKITVSNVVDLTQDEEAGYILESTGSMVLDRAKKVSFAMESPRTTEKEFFKWSELMGYEGIFIPIPNSHTKEVYHTNLMISLGTKFAVICLEVIENREEQKKVKQKLESLGKEIIEISLKQVYTFCGNILELQNNEGEKLIIMSETAQKAFEKEQLNKIVQCGKIITVSIPIIEQVGGGGIRCMMAEVFEA